MKFIFVFFISLMTVGYTFSTEKDYYKYRVQEGEQLGATLSFFGFCPLWNEKTGSVPRILKFNSFKKNHHYIFPGEIVLIPKAWEFATLDYEVDEEDFITLKKKRNYCGDKFNETENATEKTVVIIGPVKTEDDLKNTEEVKQEPKEVVYETQYYSEIEIGSFSRDTTVEDNRNDRSGSIYSSISPYFLYSYVIDKHKFKFAPFFKYIHLNFNESPGELWGTNGYDLYGGGLHLSFVFNRFRFKSTLYMGEELFIGIKTDASLAGVKEYYYTVTQDIEYNIFTIWQSDVYLSVGALYVPENKVASVTYHSELSPRVDLRVQSKHFSFMQGASIGLRYEKMKYIFSDIDQSSNSVLLYLRLSK